jgi:hypothetical protein
MGTKAAMMNGAATKTAFVPQTQTSNGRPALRLVEPRIAWLDQFYLSIGAKQMADKAPTSPLEWNGKVLGLIVSLMGAISVIVALAWYAATLSAEVDHMKQDAIKVTLMRDAQVAELKSRLDRLEAFKEEQIRNQARQIATGQSR